jgi:hypothetical protein
MQLSLSGGGCVAGVEFLLVMVDILPVLVGGCSYSLMESLILAQDERWRRA